MPVRRLSLLGANHRILLLTALISLASAPGPAADVVSFRDAAIAPRAAADPDPDPDPGTDWRAPWIAAPDPGSPSSPLPLFRKEFMLRGRITGATLRISGLGHYEAHINGRKVTDNVLTPGWTDYRKRVFYDTYDVSRMLQKGPNAIGVMLGNGMYNVEQSPGRYTKFTGTFGPPKMTARLDVHFADGREQTVSSSADWMTTPGPITYSSIYGGEDEDARLEQPGWDRPGFRATGWTPAALVAGPGGVLRAETIPPVRAFERFEPVAVTHPRPGTRVFDLGQNFAGWPEIEVSGPRGSRVKLIPGELLDAQGLVSQRSAAASPEAETAFTYVLGGQGREHWHPRFSYYGFRYIQVELDEGAVLLRRLEGRSLHDAVQQDGSFTSSDELLNRIHRLINRAMLSNMMSVLTDCPHREKLGWLEQTHLAGASLMYNYDLDRLYSKIADDMEDAQLPSGLVPSIAPEYPVFEGSFRDSPEWGAADILSTWTAYRFYGGLARLAEHYGSMRRYMQYLRGRADHHLLAYGLGDWYDIGPGPPGESKLTTKGVTATAIYYQALTAMARIAQLTGHREDAAAFADESRQVRSVFNAKFFHAQTGEYDRGSQTDNAMPLAVGLVPEEDRAAVLANLVRDIRDHANHVTAGDVGFHYVVRALTESGRSDVLYDMLERTDAPSYGDQLAHGATALTEAWDANPESSQDHFMLGHAEEWFYRGLAGIDIDLDRTEDERIRVHPAIVGQLEQAKAAFRSRLGLIESGWMRAGDQVKLTVVIPSGASATISFPDGYGDPVLINGHAPAVGGGIRRMAAGGCVVSGGTYVFELMKVHGRPDEVRDARQR